MKYLPFIYCNKDEKFNFLIDKRDLEYKIPKSEFSVKLTGGGTGSIKKALNGKYGFLIIKQDLVIVLKHQRTVS